MPDLARLAQLKAIARDTSATVWRDSDNLFGFFQRFRPDGNELERVFDGVPGGPEILERLAMVYGLTREGWENDAYFIVRRPGSPTIAELKDLTRQHLEKVRQIAVAFGQVELVFHIMKNPEIEIKEGPVPYRQIDDWPETLVYETVGDWFNSLTPATNDAHLMRDAFYTIACDYDLSRYLMWPWYRNSSPIEEPFAPYFKLWACGATVRFSAPGCVTVWRMSAMPAP